MHSPHGFLACCGTLITVMGVIHMLQAENRPLSVNFSHRSLCNNFSNLHLVYFLFSSLFDVSHQSSRRQLISFLWHTMMDLCCNPDLFWELQFLKLKACMSHGWKSYWSDVDGRLKRNLIHSLQHFIFLWLSWPLYNVVFSLLREFIVIYKLWFWLLNILYFYAIFSL